MPERIAFGPFVFDPVSHVLWREQTVVPLGGRSAALLAALLDADSQVVTKAELMERVWPQTIVEEGNLAVQVATLRRALGTRPDGEEWIVTTARVGYRLVREPGSEAAGLPAIAVLPFSNLGETPLEEYFVDGVVEGITTALSRFRTFAVVARNSAYAYRDRAADSRDMARALGARYLLEGSVRRAGERVRVGARLIDGTSGAYLWADSFEGRFEDVLDFEDSITEAVIGLIEPHLRLAEIERARRKRPSSHGAYDLYLQALPFIHGVRIVRPGQFDEAIVLLERAIALDPGFAPALGLAAWAHELRLTRGGTAPPGVDDAAEAQDLARRALAADSHDGIILAIAGIIRMTVAGDATSGLALIKRARALNPNSLLIANIAGYAHFFCHEYDEAIACHARFLRLSPGLPEAFWSMTGMARAHLAAGRIEEALTWGLRGLDASEGVDFTHAVVAAAYAHLGRPEEAAAALDRARAIWPGLSIAGLLGRTGEPDGRDRLLVEGLRRAGLPET